MNKKTATKPDLVKVKLSCVYSGDGQSWGVGEIIQVDEAESERLVSLGVASVAR